MSNTTKLGITLKLNKDIVVQREFNVYNYDFEKQISEELLYEIYNVRETIMSYMKEGTLIYMMNNQFNIEEYPAMLDTDKTENPEIFRFSITNGMNEIGACEWDGKAYPPGVRYAVDIRPMLPDIIKNFKSILKGTYVEY